MNNNFDLNIDNYSLSELEELFELPKGYNETVIDIKERKFRQNISNNKAISQSVKQSTMEFISKATEKLKSRSNANQLARNWESIYNMDRSLGKSQTVNEGATNIIVKPLTPYGQSSPSEFYQGTINPLNKRILRQNINIDTRFRQNYYTTVSSNFHVDLPLKLTDVVSLQLSALEMPNTFYVISQVFGNNFFVCEIPNNDPLLIVVPDGNYTAESLQQYLNEYFANASQVAYQSITALADPVSGKMILSNADATFVLNFLTDRYGNDDRQTPLPLKLGWMMGYRNGYYENNVSYVSEGIINLLGPKYIYLVVDDFNNSVLDGFYAAFTSSVLNKNILARVSLQGNVFNYLSKDNYNLVTTPRQYFGPVDIQKLQIQLLDEYGRILNLNNMDYSFCLTFQTIYDL